MQANQTPFSATEIERMNQSLVTGPSAFTSIEIRLEELIDLDQFPLHDLNSPLRKELVMQCRDDLKKQGCSLIKNFVRPEAIDAMREESLRLMPFAVYADDSNNPYFSADDPSLPEDHPKRYFQARTSAYINSDMLEEQSTLRKIYDSDVIVHFLSECINNGPIYRWADPLGRNPYSVMQDGDYLPWHFDGNDFTVSILVQESDEGGIFEYRPSLRSAQDENFEEVKKVLNGKREDVLELPLKEGDLQLFHGRYSLHRVTKTVGKTPRIIALPTYHTNPYLVNRPHHSQTLYGRSLPVHEQRNLARGDSLMD